MDLWFGESQNASTWQSKRPKGARSLVAEQAAHNRLVEGSNPLGPTLRLILLARSTIVRDLRSGCAHGLETGAIRGYVEEQGIEEDYRQIHDDEQLKLF